MLNIIHKNYILGIMNKKTLLILAILAIACFGVYQFIDYRDRMSTLSMAPEEIFGWETQVKFAKAHRGDLQLKEARLVKTIGSAEDIAETVEKVIGDDAYTILYDRNGEDFEVITIGEKRRRLSEEGFDFDIIISRIKRSLGNISGFPDNSVSLLEFEWRYRGKKYISYGVEMKDLGGIAYESLGYYTIVNQDSDRSYRVSEKMNEKLGAMILRESNIFEITTQSIFGIITSRATIYLYSEFRDGVHYESTTDVQRICTSGYLMNIECTVNDYDGESEDVYDSDFSRFRFGWLLMMDDLPDIVSLDGIYEDSRVLRHIEYSGSGSSLERL